MSVRSEKVGSLIKEELGLLFQRNFSMADYGFLTVTEVLMSPDLKVAKVYVSIFGDEVRKKKSFAKLEAQKPIDSFNAWTCSSTALYTRDYFLFG